MSNRSVLITGATGIMGGWVVGEALTQGYTPVVLMRDADPGQARQRLAAILRLVGKEEDLDQVRVVQGDTRLPQLGMNSAAVRNVSAEVGGMIHCAACTSFNPRQRKEVWATNVEGCRHVVDFVSKAGIPLYHVSTAYVAGRRSGRAHEDELIGDYGFNNPYEESKFRAEHIVHEAIAQERIQAAIFRPGILVGAAHAQGRISQFLNFYHFLRLIDMASRGRLNGTRVIRISANPEATKNLVPVDWAASALWAIIEAEGPCARTYHLTNPRPASHQSVQEWANAYLKPSKVRIEFQADGGDRAGDDAGGSLRGYAAYLHGEPHFDRANTDRALGGQLAFPAVDSELYGVLLEYAQFRRWKGIFGCPTNPVRIATKVNNEHKESALTRNAAAVG